MITLFACVLPFLAKLCGEKHLGYQILGGDSYEYEYESPNSIFTVRRHK